MSGSKYDKFCFIIIELQYGQHALSNALYACFHLRNTLVIYTSNTWMEGQAHLLVICIQMIGNPIVVTQVLNKMGPSILPWGAQTQGGLDLNGPHLCLGPQ